MPISQHQQNLRITVNYYPAAVRRIKSVGWVIEYHVLHPKTQKMVRKRIKINVLHKRCGALFREETAKICNQINAKLAGGWSPFFESDNARLYVTLDKVRDAYLAEKQKELRPATIRCYQSGTGMLTKWAAKAAPEIYASMFNKVLAVRYLDYIYNTRNVDGRAWNNQLKMARAFFEWAKEKCYVKENPFEGIKPKKLHDKRRTIIPPDTRALITNYFQKELPQMVLVCHLVHSSLIRPKEIRMIQVQHIDIEHRCVFIPSENAKTHIERFAVLSKKTIEILKNLKINELPKDYYLIGGGRDLMPAAAPAYDTRLSKLWIEMRRALKLPQEMQLYSLRDTGINGMLKAGLDPLTVMQAADHHDLAMTMRYANHADPDLINKVYQSAPEF